jgi:Flp pilus assembly pilin Flp
MKKLNNNRGQGLIEYLVLVCIIAVGSMAVIRIVGKNVEVQFANISRALGGQDGKLAAEKVTADDYAKRDFSDFMTGAGSADSGPTAPNKGGSASKPGIGDNLGHTMPEILGH